MYPTAKMVARATAMLTKPKSNPKGEKSDEDENHNKPQTEADDLPKTRQRRRHRKRKVCDVPTEVTEPELKRRKIDPVEAEFNLNVISKRRKINLLDSSDEDEDED